MLGEGVEKREPSYTIGGNVNWYSHDGDQYGSSLKKQKQNYHMTQQSHSWAYMEKTKISKGTCIPVFIVELFTIAVTWKQPKCPSTEEWIKKRWYVYTMDYYLAVKGVNCAICRDVDRHRECHTELSKSEREKQIQQMNAYI